LLLAAVVAEILMQVAAEQVDCLLAMLVLPLGLLTL